MVCLYLWGICLQPYPPPIRLEGHAHLFFELQRLREQVPPVVTQEGVSSVCVCGYECLGPCGFRKPV